MIGGYLYLASPYDAYPRGHQAAYDDACWATAKFIHAGFTAFSPIAHGHGVALADPMLGTDAASWKIHNDIMLAHSDGLVVLCLEAWEVSKGIKDEVDFAYRHSLRVRWWSPGDQVPGVHVPPPPHTWSRNDNATDFLSDHSGAPRVSVAANDRCPDQTRHHRPRRHGSGASIIND